MGSLRKLNRRAVRGMVREEAWIAARRKLPAYVGDAPDPYRPTVVMWLDPREGVVAFELVQGRGEQELAQLFQRAVTQPMVGPPRKPSRVWVEEPVLADVLRRELGGSLTVTVGPAPLVDELMGQLFDHLRQLESDMPEPYRGYLAGARLHGTELEPARVRELFIAAEHLFRTAPWSDWADAELIAVDIPELGVEDACLSLVGMLGESLGFLLFPSLTAYDTFNQMAEERHELEEELDPETDIDLGTEFLALNFAALADLAPDVRKELAREGWPMAAPNAYPIVERRDRNAIVMPLVERDVRIATAIAAALTRFFGSHQAAVAAGEPASMTIQTEAGPSVRLTLPYEAKGEHQPREAAPAPFAEPARLRDGERHPVHAIEERLAKVLIQYGAERFGKQRVRRVGSAIDDGEGAIQLIWPWTIYGHLFDQRTLSDWYLSEHAGRLSREERAWLEAQRGAWLGIWKVESIEPERGVHVLDVLSGQRRFVCEVAASRVLQPSIHVFGRVVEYAGDHVFCGLHPRILRSVEAAAVIEKAQKYLRSGAHVDPGRLREPKTAKALLRYWHEAAQAAHERAERPLTLSNSHGDALLWTIDHYRFAAADHSAIERALTQLDPEPSRLGKDLRFDVLSSAVEGNVVLGTVTLGPDRLRVEANSTQRADDLRARLEALLGAKLTHAARTHSDPLSQAQPAAPPFSAELPPEAHEAVRAFKRRHYATWADVPVPALSNQTPRRAVKTKRGRALVSALLEDMERMERLGPPSAAYDFSGLRAELGL